MKKLTNRRTRAYLGLAACVAFCAAAVPILAHDFMIPNYRGDELTVYSEWDFEIDQDYTDLMNIVPDDLDWVGKPGYELYDTWTHAHVVNMYWQDGIWYVLPDAPFGEINFWLVNWIDDMPVKHLWIQISYGGQGAPPFVVEITGYQWEVYEGIPDPVFQDYGGTLKYVIDHSLDRRVEDWMIVPNPDVESITIHVPAGTWLDQVVIDTISTWDFTSTENKTLSGVKNLFR